MAPDTESRISLVSYISKSRSYPVFHVTKLYVVQYLETNFIQLVKCTCYQSMLLNAVKIQLGVSEMAQQIKVLLIVGGFWERNSVFLKGVASGRSIIAQWMAPTYMYMCTAN